MAAHNGECLIINNETQVILRIPVKDRSVSIYLDKHQDGPTTAGIYQSDGDNSVDNPQIDFIQALEWLANGMNEQPA